MSDELEDALRRELKASWVPLDPARAEEMARTAAQAGLAGSSRGWVAPLAAAAAVVVVGGGVALATGGGSGTSANGPAGGGPGVSSTGTDGVLGSICTPVGTGSESAGLGTVAPVYSATPTPVGTYAAIGEGSAPADLPTASPTAPSGSRPPHAPSSAPAGTATGAPSALPTGVSAAVSSAAPTKVPSESASAVGTETLAPTEGVVICDVGTAAPSPLRSADCTAVKAVERAGGRHYVIECIASASEVGPPTVPPTAAASDPSVSAATCDAPGTCPGDVVSSVSTHQAGDDTFTINTTVAPGETKTFDGPDIPAGRTLVADSMIFQNPAADTGTFTLEGDAEHRLSLAMSDFHDLDYHYGDTAPSYDADHPLRVTVDCTNSAVACTPDVLVSGHYTG